MKAFLLLCIVAALAAAALFVPVAGKPLWVRADLPRSAARLTAHGLRASWDFVAGLGHRPATPETPPHSPRQPAAKKNNFFSAQARTPSGILPQPPKEKLQRSDKDALDKLVAKGR